MSTVGAVDGMTEATVIDYVFYIVEEKLCGSVGSVTGTAGPERVPLSTHKHTAPLGMSMSEKSAVSTLDNFCWTPGSGGGSNAGGEVDPMASVSGV